MTEARGRVRLTRHARGKTRTGGSRTDELQRDVHAEHQRMGYPHDTHAAFAEFAYQAIAIPDHVAGEVERLGRVIAARGAIRLVRRFSVLGRDELVQLARSGGGHVGPVTKRESSCVAKTAHTASKITSVRERHEHISMCRRESART
jgi:hypothetical protein